MTITRIQIINNPNAAKDSKRAVAVFYHIDPKAKKEAVFKRVKFGFYKSGGTFYDGASDEKRHAYIARHIKGGQNWKKSGIMTSGYLSRWVLWQYRSKAEIQAKLKRDSGASSVSIAITKQT